MPQASLDPLSICEAVIVAFPKASKATLMFLQLATGRILSSTVTVVLQLLVRPAASVTVTVTFTGVATFEQLNVFGETALVTMLQLSVEPAVIVLILAGDKVYVPLEFNCMVSGVQAATGLIKS